MEYPATRATAETLPNGLVLILDPDATAPVVSTQLWVGTGSIHEDRLLGAGVSHFLEHMVFKGTRDHDADELAAVVQAAGGHWNAYTTFDRTVYYIDGPSSSMPTFLRCLTGLVFHPVIPESEFAKEKDIIGREIDMGLDDPDEALMRLLFASTFQHDPRRQPVIGHRHLLEALEHADLLRYHRDRYTTDRCFLVISGDFDPQQARDLVSALTDDCKPSGGREPLVAIDAPQLGPRRTRGTFAVTTSRLSLAWKIPPLEDAATPAFEVLAAILGRGRSSRLYRTLREETPLALEISAYAWHTSGREGLLGISAEALVEHRDALAAAMIRSPLDLDDAWLDADIAKAKRQIAASQFGMLTTASARAGDLAINWHETRDLDFTRRHLAAIQAVGRDDVLAAAATLDEARSTLAVLDPHEAAAPRGSAAARNPRGAIETRVLPNGITLALVPDRRVPLVHMCAAIRCGLPEETPATNGIGQLLASTLTRGTTSRGPAEIARLLESLGASVSAIAGNQTLLVQGSGLSADADALVAVFCETLASPAFDADVIGREKASQLAVLDESLQDPLQLAIRTLRHAAFQGVGYALDSLGSTASIHSLDRDSLANHHRRHLHHRNLTLAVTGDFDPDAIADRLSQGLDSLPGGERPDSPASRLGHGIECGARLPKKQAVLAIGFHSASATSPDRHALAMIHAHACDMAGPLFSHLREDLGLAYQVGATQFLGHDTGLFTFYIATAPDQAALARDELLREIRTITRDGIPDDAFERVRSTMLSGLAIRQQSLAQTSRTMALDTMLGLPADEQLRLAETYRTLTPQAVRDTAARLFGTDPCIATILPDS
jgi:zinc protease